MTKNLRFPHFLRLYVICALLGMSSGLPLFCLMNLVPVWLKSFDISTKVIGFSTIVMFPYAWKFLWAPLVDRFQLPFLSRRRGWIASTQLILAVCMLGVGYINPKTEITLILTIGAVMSFVSATQDIVIDAYRREFFTDEQQSAMMAVFMNAYKLIGLIPGSVALIMADQGYSWPQVWQMNAGVMLLGFFVTLWIQEPEYTYKPPSLLDAFILPFKEFFSRFGIKQALMILLFICLYKLGDTMATTLASVFYLDLGYTKSQIGVIAKQAGLWSSIAGGILGAMWMHKLGIFKSLVIFGFLQFLAIFGFLWLANGTLDKTLWSLALVIGVEAFTVGLASAAIGGYLASITSRAYSATQFALFSSLAAVPRTLLASSTGVLQEQLGWSGFFQICLLIAVPGMVLLFVVFKKTKNFQQL